MTISFYDQSVGSYRRTIESITKVLTKGLDHCREKGTDAEALVDARLYDDMAPLRFQIVSIAHHSLGALEGMKRGEFGPPTTPPGLDYAGCQKMLADTDAALAAMSKDDVNALGSRDITFKAGERQVPFTAEGFLLSFSLPNFYFHATTAYDILRSRGVPLGKRDFLGRMLVKN